MFSFSPEAPDIRPAFAREATQHLLDGDIQRALELCTQGIVAFPRYATAYFVLGKCYESLGRTVESLLEYRRALSILPDNPEIQLLVKHAEEKEQRAFQRFVREQEKKLKGQQKAISIDEFLVGESPGDTAIEHLAKRLQDAKRIQLIRSADSIPVSEAPENKRGFVTATMAEIYAAQGTYAESIKAYREILKHHPEEKERFEKRIRELEELLVHQQRGKKAEGPPQ